MSQLKSISPERAAELVRAGAMMIDIREADEHAREHIPGARHHALSLIEATVGAVKVPVTFTDHPAEPVPGDPAGANGDGPTGSRRDAILQASLPGI